VQAVEAYHRRASNHTDLPSAEHESRMKAILDAAPAGHRDWLAEQLRFSNELKLRRRLKLLFAKFSALFDGLLPDRKAMINAIYENRNCLTHYDPACGGRTATGARLLLMVATLKLLLQACLMDELGLPQTTFNEFILRSRTVRMIRHLNDRSAAEGA
jgi:HEPN superfamily Apea-like protein